MKTLSQSKHMSHEYCCTIVKIGEVKPIDGSDFLGQVLVEGRTIVVRKDEIHEGDILFYVQNESQINRDFTFVNNLFDDKTLNYDTSQKGYINKNCRIRMVKLRGVLSMGFLFSVSCMKKWYPNFDVDISQHIGEDFDTVNGELFVKAYVPPVKESNVNRNKSKNNNLNKIDCLIPGKFQLHYDTQQLNRNMDKIQPNDVVSISVKMHGTSIVIGNVLTKYPKFNGLYFKLFPYLPKFLKFYKEKYTVIYSSRTVIKNRNINPKVKDGYYNKDVWGEYYELLKNYIPENMTIYGEIVGYVGGTNTMIQKGYDYGCKPGENKLMIYRITTEDETGKKYEWNVPDVYDFTLLLKDKVELKDKIHPIDILYHGTLKNLYEDVSITTHWSENILEKMKNEITFGMEQDEPMCRNKVPREGFCLRIDNDIIDECFKLKCLKFLNRESKLIDDGVIDDFEMQERY